MKYRYPEIIAITLIAAAFIFPPWNSPLRLDMPHVRTYWTYIWDSENLISSIDIKLLGLELVAIIGIYYLLVKLIDGKN
jgi:hypothetical protein